MMSKKTKTKNDDAPVVKRFNQIQHKEAGKLKAGGIRTLLGARDYGSMEVGLRSFLSNAVMAAKEAREEKVRMDNKLTDYSIPLTGEHAIEVATAATLMSITGASAEVMAAPEVVAAAESSGVEVVDGNVVIMNWDDDPKATLKVFQAMIDPDMLITLTMASKAIASLSDEDVVALGKDSTYGLASDLDWQD